MSLSFASTDAKSSCQASGLGIDASGLNDTSTEPVAAAGTAVIAILTSVLALMIVVGNGLIIMSVAVVKKLRQPANYLIVSLALSDFLVGLVVLPLTIIVDIGGEWVFGSMMCDVHVSFDVICCTASIMNLCMISIDRYLMITQPMTYPKQRNGKLMAVLITTAWLISALIIIPALFGFTENVKDEPSWLQLPSSSVVDESGKLFPGKSKPNGTYFEGDHSATFAIDGNSSTFWEPPTVSRGSEEWHFILDLGQSYKITKLSLQNVGDKIHDVILYNIQFNQCTNGNTRVEEFFNVKSGTDVVQERLVVGDVETRYLRMNVNQTTSNGKPRVREFAVFGDKSHGKTCLISQEVWFTIYSTVGAFYIPLAVMLCMYWKIYREASKFNARHRMRSASYSGSQEWSATPPSTPDPISTEKSRSARFFAGFIKRPSNLNNNYAKAVERLNLNKVKMKEDGIVDSNEHLLTNGLLKANGITVVVTSECDKTSCFDEDTISSECEFLPSDRNDSKSVDFADDSSGEDKRLVNGNEIINGRYKNYELKTTSLPGRASSHRKQTSNNSINSNGVCRNGKMPPSILRSRTHSDNNINFQREATPSQLTQNSINGSTGNNLSNGEWRFPTISENNVLELTGNNAPSSGRDSPNKKKNITTKNRESPRQRPLYTRSHSASCKGDLHGNRTRHSICSGSSGCCTKPLFRRATSSPPPRTASATMNPPSRNAHRRTSLPSKCGLLSVDAPSNGRRPTVFKQLRRRVSMATSRDRMRNVKATRTLGIIVGAFTFCWLPFFTVTFLRPFICENPESQDCIPMWLVRLVLWLGYVNSALNPLIYIGFSPDLRETFRFLLSCKCTNVDRRLAQTELRQAVLRERRESAISRSFAANESIL